MKSMPTVAREISYSNGAGSRGGRAMIRLIENTTGRLSLIRRARGYEDDVAEGRDFWEVICSRYGIGLDVVGGSLEAIPSTGPLVLVSNHPYGILDGLTMGRILSERRGGDFRVLAHRIFRRAPDLEKIILPVSFEDTKEASAQNLATRAEALRYLGAGGAIGIFPGGTVSTSARPMGLPLDPAWRTFTAKMIARSNATVVPIFFEGHNSRLFQLASHVHSNLRLGMLLRAFVEPLLGSIGRVVVGQPISHDDLKALRTDPKAMMDFLRRATYDLSPRPLGASRLGHEFEARHRPRDIRDGSGHLR